MKCFICSYRQIPDVIIGLEESGYTDYHLTVNIPTSGVLFLRKTSDTPEEIKKVADNLTQRKHKNVRKELDKIMCGKILEFTGEKLIEENKKETAIRMIEDGTLTDDKIAQFSGLTIAQVKDLREQETVMA